MGERVNKECGQVIGAPSIFPERVRQAASCLEDFFGDRRFGSVGQDDFRAYVAKSAEWPAGTDNRPVGSPAERARYDFPILGTIAGFAGEIALWELIQAWLEDSLAAMAEARP